MTPSLVRSTRAVAAALAIASAMAGCTRHAAGAPTVAVERVATDGESGAIVRIDVAIERATAHSREADFFVTRDDAFGEFWRVADATPASGGALHVTLRPVRAGGDFTAGDAVAVRLLDRAASTTAISFPYAVARGTASGVRDASFTAWPAGADRPAAWFATGDGSGVIRRRREGALAAVELELTAVRPDTWNTHAIEQDVAAEHARFRIDVRTSEACDGNRRWPRDLSGIALYDRLGYVVTYCISDRIARRSVYRNSDGKQVIVVVPGRRGVWQTIDVDPGAFARDVPLARDGGPVRIGLGLRVNPAGDAPPNVARSIAFANLRSE